MYCTLFPSLRARILHLLPVPASRNHQIVNVRGTVAARDRVLSFNTVAQHYLLLPVLFWTVPSSSHVYRRRHEMLLQATPCFSSLGAKPSFVLWTRSRYYFSPRRPPSCPHPSPLFPLAIPILLGHTNVPLDLPIGVCRTSDIAYSAKTSLPISPNCIPYLFPMGAHFVRPASGHAAGRTAAAAKDGRTAAKQDPRLRL